tara:strand:- start:1306 stop:1704 length:399 start_codon:yes stop_codon:yes gene_type:complete
VFFLRIFEDSKKTILLSHSEWRVVFFPLFLVIFQGQVPLPLPCYDFTSVTFDRVGKSSFFPRKEKKKDVCTSPEKNFQSVTGGVYKVQVRVHRGILIRDYSQFLLYEGELQPPIRTKEAFEGSLKVSLSITY